MTRLFAIETKNRRTNLYNEDELNYSLRMRKSKGNQFVIHEMTLDPEQKIEWIKNKREFIGVVLKSKVIMDSEYPEYLSGRYHQGQATFTPLHQKAPRLYNSHNDALKGIQAYHKGRNEPAPHDISGLWEIVPVYYFRVNVTEEFVSHPLKDGLQNIAKHPFLKENERDTINQAIKELK